jgi:Holliday junction resolvase RusA-like endonuclease
VIQRRIILPLPSVEGSNSRSHWGVRRESAKCDRMIAAIEARAHGLVGPLKNPVVVVDWYQKTKRSIDCDNALSRCKSYIDGLTDAEWWVDDKAIREMTIRVWAPGENGGYKAKVVITVLDAPRLLTIDSVFG